MKETITVEKEVYEAVLRNSVRVNDLEAENQQLKTQIAKLTEIVGVLPSNHSVGNLGYKIKNQRHEINNRLKEIDKLKELLREVRDAWVIYKPYDRHQLCERIDNAIGEKK